MCFELIGSAGFRFAANSDFWSSLCDDVSSPHVDVKICDDNELIISKFAHPRSNTDYSFQHQRQWFHRFEKASTINMTKSQLGCQSLAQTENLFPKGWSQISIRHPLWLCNGNEFCLMIISTFATSIGYLKSITIESGSLKPKPLHSNRDIWQKPARSDLWKRGTPAPTTTQDGFYFTIKHTRKWETTTRQTILNTFLWNPVKAARTWAANKQDGWKKKFDPFKLNRMKERRAAQLA